MIIKYYFNNYIRKIILFVIYLNLFFFCNFTHLYAEDSKSNLENIELDNKNTIIPRELQAYVPNDELDKQIFLSLERLLNKDNFDIMDSKMWLLKAMLYAATPFACGANTLIIAKTSAVTARLVLAAQFTVPRTIENICFLVDKANLALSEQKLANWIREIPDSKRNVVKACWSLIRLAVGLYLAYAYSLIDAKTAGDAYRWIYEGVTSSKSFLDTADNVGYFLNFCYTAMLGAIFFYQLIDEILMRSNLGYLIGICPPATKDLEYEAYMDDLSELRSRCTSLALENKEPQYMDVMIEEYLSDRNINSIYNVASLQNCLAAKETPRSRNTNIAINLFKLFFVAGATVLCGVSFKYIFASNTILRNYVDAVGNEVSTDLYEFKLKTPVNGSSIFNCTSVSDCTDGVNFDNIIITDSQKDKLLELNKTADLANILQGVAISADTAVLILSAASILYSISTSKLHSRAIKIGLWRKSKIIAAIAATLIFPAMVFYLDNVNDVRPVAKTANRLLESTGQSSFLPVDLGIASTIGVLGATFFLGFRLLSNLPYAVAAIPRVIKSIPEDFVSLKSKL